MILFQSFDGLLWLLVALAVFIFLQRSLHREIQAFFLILTRNPGITQAVFALIFFPGVLVHELSHFIMAKILFVRTGRFSLIPASQPDGTLRLGYVETASGGIIRDALIGAAPLITGGLFVAYTGLYRMNLLPLWEQLRVQNWASFWHLFLAIPKTPDFWLWFYLAFAVSSTMMPSSSDRHAWLPMGFLVVGLVLIAVIAGAGTWMLVNLAPGLDDFFQGTSMVLALSGSMHIILILPFLLLHRLLSKVTGVDIG